MYYTNNDKLTFKEKKSLFYIIFFHIIFTTKASIIYLFIKTKQMITIRNIEIDIMIYIYIRELCLFYVECIFCFSFNFD